MSTGLRIGVLGSAEIARRRLLPAFAADPAAEVAAVASRDAGRAAELAERFGARAVTGYQTLLELPEVDAVYLPLPAALHAEWTERALLAGKHVLAEKPLGGDRASTRRLLQLARERGLVLMENVMFVHHPQHAEVLRLVARGAIGVPRAFSAAFAIPRLPAGDIRYDAQLGGGALADVGVYPVRAAMHLLGGPLTVVGAALDRTSDHDVDINGAALLRSPEGVLAQLTFGLDHAYRSRYELWGSEGSIRLDRAFTPPADHRPVLQLERGGTVEQRVLDAEDQVARTVRAFVSACRAGGTGTGAAACLEQARLLDEIRRAAQ
ncbi:Gfo/Idh/MocA family protein [Kitasatospora azatica]|uniref:Gfo/Idh/MocA family protein n=1 Tax=Kitasatospora azatica TaxID=58347 RepID=UPI00056A154C|nr:Gfo/Idh/MocA family oxidoreductase [Kitasatospora azatica]